MEELTKVLETKQMLSTAYHPQTDVSRSLTVDFILFSLFTLFYFYFLFPFNFLFLE